MASHPPIRDIDLTVGLLGPTPGGGDLLVLGFALAIGFVIGLSTGSLLRRILMHWTANKHTETFRMSDALFSTLEPKSWDPCEIRTGASANELTSQQEQVLRLLIANQGRMKQSEISSSTGWSEAKISRLLQRMEDGGDISRISVGRHNLILIGNYPSTAARNR